MAAPAHAAPVERAVERAIEPLGTGASVVVTDARTGRRVVALRGKRRQSLGSTTKPLTAAAVYELLDPGFRLSTDVFVNAPPDPAGVIHGDLVLRGGGDPLLDDAQLSALADGLGGVREITGAVVGDESRFDTVRTGPSGDGVFDAELGGPLSALAYRKGGRRRTAPCRRTPPAPPRRASTTCSRRAAS
jgi:D-alanyl-D-alanine carboxypeptidase/D-alanyl-D-alanine-endopeptidase (penicillin-binding protein 4)